MRDRLLSRRWLVPVLLAFALAGVPPETPGEEPEDSASSPGPDPARIDCGAEPCLGGVVVGVADGDTVTLLVEPGGAPGSGVRRVSLREGNPAPEQVRVRLEGIDTPERAQPWGARARQSLADKVLRRRVRVGSKGEDRYGRLLGRIYLGSRDINREMVREGHAWVYRRYTSDPGLIADERTARASRVGLWSLPQEDRVPPWDWRRQRRRAGSPQVAAPAPGPETRTCGAKTYCREMVSCAEARFHLTACGLSRLDGDGDGVPCETICSGTP